MILINWIKYSSNGLINAVGLGHKEQLILHRFYLNKSDILQRVWYSDILYSNSRNSCENFQD